MSRRAVLALSLAVALLATAGLPITDGAGAAPPRVTPDLDVETWATGLVTPWDVAFMPDGHALITEHTTGTVWVRRRGGALTRVEAPQNDFRWAGEGGLLGIAVDPRFAQNRRYYTCQNSRQGDVRVIRWRLDESLASATRQRVLVDDIPMSSGRHSGCRLAFDHEGSLFVATGDAAIGSTPQNLGSLGGKVLRISPATGNGHRKNPFFTTAGADRSKVYTYGHRNPQGLARRPCTSEMWTGEHGPSVNDEINLLRRGGNYGWNPVPGYNEGVPMTDFSLPGRQLGARWASGGSTIALSGIGWIRGSDWGGWDGELAGATLKNRQLWIYEFNNKGRLLDTDRPAELDQTLGRLRVPVMGPDGSLYVASQSTGSVHRVTPTAGRDRGNQDVNGDGFDDLVIGAPGRDPRNRSGAGQVQVVFGSRQGLAPADGTQRRDQRHLEGSRLQAGDETGRAVAYGDVDGDGTTDVVVGSPGEAVRGRRDAGSVQVVCGRTDGIQGRSSQTFSQVGPVAGIPERNDRFGSAVAIGDFNGDGLGDVASGAPGESAGGAAVAGSVTVLYGTMSGLTTVGSQQWRQGGPVPDTSEALDRFGAALAVGNFDGDGYQDLAIGVPGESVAGVAASGAVTILYGSPTGLRADRAQSFDQRTTASDVGADDRFGAALAAGDFDGDGSDDLAIGAPGESLGGAADAGEVTVLFGSVAGLGTGGAQVLSQGVGAPGSSDAGDGLGQALDAGDIDGDGIDDLVAGSPGERGGAGRIVVWLGSPGGLGTGASFSQVGPAPGVDEPGDEMGRAVRVADFDGDGHADVAVGLPGEDVNGREDAGAVVVLMGSSGGLTTDGRVISLATRGVPGRATANDRFGSAL